MNRSAIVVAVSAALAVNLVVIFSFLGAGGRSSGSGETDGADQHTSRGGGEPGFSGTAGGFYGASSSARRNRGKDDGKDSTAGEGDELAASLRELRRPSSRAQEAGTKAGKQRDRGDSPEGRDGKSGGEAARSIPLRGAQLVLAMQEALEAEDLAELQGLLISELTMKGTHFTAEDAGLLFDVLMDVDDYGLQKLALTHLERIEGSPEGLIDGYFEYLETAETPHHSKEILERLVKMGGDGTVLGLSDLVRQTENERLRRDAALALGQLKDPRGVPPIRDVLASLENPREARQYADALAHIGGREAISTLVDYAARPGNESALGSLREIRDPNVGPILSGELNGRVSESYQRTALQKLASLADPQTLPDLGRYIHHAEGSMLRYGIYALGRFSDPQAARILETFAGRQHDPKLAEMALRTAQRVQRNIERAQSSQDPSRRREEPRERRRTRQT